MRILIDEIMLNQKIKINQNDALIIIDVQNDFCPNGALAVPNGDQIIEPINKTIPLFKHIILSQDWHPRDHKSFASNHKDKNPFQTLSMPYGEQILWPDHCIIGTSGAKFHPALNVNLAQCVIRKGYNREIDSYSTFFENDKISPTGLAGYLRENNIKTCIDKLSSKTNSHKCTQCGFESIKHFWQCPSCQHWSCIKKDELNQSKSSHYVV